MTDQVAEVATSAFSGVEGSISSGASKFVDLLKDFNVIGFVLGLLMSNSVSDIANSLIDSIIMPTIKPFLDRVSRKNDTIEIGGFILHLEKFINAVIKFLVLAIIIFIFVTLGVTVTKPVNWVKIQAINPDVKL